MADHSANQQASIKIPLWILNDRERPAMPPKAFLNRLQYTYDHPEEVRQKLRKDALQAGEESNAFAKKLAGMMEMIRPVQLEAGSEATAQIESYGETFQNLQLSDDVDAAVRINMHNGSALGLSLHHASISAVKPATTQRRRSVSPSVNTRPRLGERGQITKPTQVKPNNRQIRKKPTRGGRTSIASRRASAVDVDQPQAAAESSSPLSAPQEAVTAGVPSPGIVRPTTTQSTAQPYPFPARSTMPLWYTSISSKSLALLDRKRPQEIAAIDALKDCIRRCEIEKQHDRLTKEFNNLRDHIHKAEIKLDMDKLKVRKTRILTDTGLPRIFSEATDFPWDLKADAWYLYERWMNKDFEHDILRGIVTVKAKDRNGDRLDRLYVEKHPKDPKNYGDNGAVLGQWWPSQLCAVRDGVHGAAQGGKLIAVFAVASADYLQVSMETRKEAHTASSCQAADTRTGMMVIRSNTAAQKAITSA